METYMIDSEDVGKGEIIVDEALLRGNGTDDPSVYEWNIVTNRFAPDPRRNAWVANWENLPSDFVWKSDYQPSTNYTRVAELPFIHFDAPLSTIGDIGHLYAGYTTSGTIDPGDRGYDTITFSSVSGAALLDVFTLFPTNGPVSGLVQANTALMPVLDLLFTDAAIEAGWLCNEMYLEKEAGYVDLFKEAGTNVIELDAATIQSFRDAVAPAFEDPAICANWQPGLREKILEIANG